VKSREGGALQMAGSYCFLLARSIVLSHRRVLTFLCNRRFNYSKCRQQNRQKNLLLISRALLIWR
jgi:hypothetical protein